MIFDCVRDGSCSLGTDRNQAAGKTGARPTVGSPRRVARQRRRQSQVSAWTPLTSFLATNGRHRLLQMQLRHQTQHWSCVVSSSLQQEGMLERRKPMASSREREYSEGSSCPVPATERIARDQVAQFPGTRVQRGIKLPSSREREDSEGYQVVQFPGKRG